MKLNAEWHRAHLMPKNATTAQRLAWHLEHQKRCACRPIPEKLLEQTGTEHLRVEWKCPRCGRSFAQRNARHSCDVQTVASYFAGREALLPLFERVRTVIEKLGPVEVEVTKSQISFRARTRFAWVWLPQLYLKNAPEDELVLTFDLPVHKRSPRIKEVVEVRPGRFTHHLVLRTAKQLDTEVRGWLKDAHAYASRPARRAASTRARLLLSGLIRD